MIVLKNPILFTFILSRFMAIKGNPDVDKYFKRLDTCECGMHNNLAPRIVGGHETKPNEYPWMVTIFYGGNLHCGGTLINDRYVLTAGHCLQWSRKERLSVVFGLHNIDERYSAKERGFKIDIESLIVHEDFSSDNLHDTDDIGLIKLKKPVQFSSEFSPVCLPDYGDDYSGNLAQVIGWGKTSEHGYAAPALRSANVTVLSNEICKSVKGIGKHITDSMLCAYENQVDACQGDSGGPLIRESETGKIEQIGVVSWGVGCAKPNLPGIYSRVTNFLEWIALHTLDANYCTI